MSVHGIVITFLLVFPWVLVGVVAEAAHPPGVPDLTDHEVQDGLVVLAVSLLEGDPDFPVLVLAGGSGALPRYLLVVVDARSGKDAWSLREDHPIFFMVFSDSTELRGAYLDEGFAASGKPSGHFSGVGPEAVERLVGKLRHGHRQARGLVAESNVCESVPHAAAPGGSIHHAEAHQSASAESPDRSPARGDGGIRAATPGLAAAPVRGRCGPSASCEHECSILHSPFTVDQPSVYA